MKRSDRKTRKPKARDLLGAYASGILSPDEESRLFRAALEDQELFNDLAHEDLFREALGDEEFRSRLKRRIRELDDEPQRASKLGFLDWFRNPAFAFAAAAAATLLVVGLPHLSKLRWPAGQVAPDDSGSETIVPKGLQSLPKAAQPTQLEEAALKRIWTRANTAPHPVVSLELDRPGQVPRYPAGEPMRISFLLSRDANVLILDEDPEGIVTQVFPSEDRRSPLVCADERVFLPRAGEEPRLAASKPGLHRLRLLVLPPGSDLLEGIAVGQRRPPAAELRYRVLEQQEGAP